MATPLPLARFSKASPCSRANPFAWYLLTTRYNRAAARDPETLAGNDNLQVTDSNDTKYKRLTYLGDWTVGKDMQDSTKYNLDIGLNDFNDRGGFATSFDLREYKGQIGIWYFIGDPDSGDRFFFIKKTNLTN